MERGAKGKEVIKAYGIRYCFELYKSYLKIIEASQNFDSIDPERYINLNLDEHLERVPYARKLTKEMFLQSVREAMSLSYTAFRSNADDMSYFALIMPVFRSVKNVAVDIQKYELKRITDSSLDIKKGKKNVDEHNLSDGIELCGERFDFSKYCAHLLKIRSLVEYKHAYFLNELRLFRTRFGIDKWDSESVYGAGYKALESDKA